MNLARYVWWWSWVLLACTPAATQEPRQQAPTAATPRACPVGTTPLDRRVSTSCVPPSAIFCGNVRMYKNDGATPWSGTPDVSSKEILAVPGSQGTQRAVCMPNANAPRAEKPSRVHVEVRGWIHEDPIFKDGDEEYTFNVTLDYGWQTDAPGVFAINTPELVNTYVSAHNIVDEGDRWPWDDVNGAPLFSTYGGFGNALMHVEIDGWGPDRGGANYEARRPPDWNAVHMRCGGPGCAVYYPFPILHDDNPSKPIYHVGDYVRLVGTLWEDGPHINGTVVAGIDWACDFNRKLTPEDCSGKNDAKKCWNQDSTQGRGWYELHPVDVMEVPTSGGGNSPAGRLYAFAVCVTSGDHANIDVDKAMIYGRKWPNSKIVFHEYIDGTFTNWKSIRPQNGPHYQVYGDEASLHIGVEGTSSYRGLLKGMFAFEWQCTPTCANRCDSADDGCGGHCTTSCTPPASCVNHACVAPAPPPPPPPPPPPACVPHCTGKQCGDDGCGGSCGACRNGATCDDSQRCRGACAGALQWCDCNEPPRCMSAAACQRACKQ